MRLPLAVTLVIALCAPLPAWAADAPLTSFYGQWRGTEVAVENDGLGIELRPDDLNVTITPDGDGFRLHWVTLERHPLAGTFTRREAEARFQPTARPGVFAFEETPGTLLGRLFASPATGNPLEGETLLWARLDGPALVIYSLGITHDGGFDLHRAAHRLEDGDMALEHTIRIEDQAEIAIRGRLKPAGS